ncbi:Peptidase family M48 [Glycomyces sambucus]|uniref:Peptidase family M48 n=1 Tax=Glycomyces sambucus TaxID=380244 RepID=A0A1G9H4P8_9ACTN|nr:M56 family metallopeptidase [Glycomyces sambucus]SDL07957.1 Peptidase family M48 [Glycomyces sambucus]
MTAAALLLAYAAALAVLGPRLLDRAAWTAGAPRLAIGTWFATAGSFLLAVVLAGVVIVVPLEVHHGAGGEFVWHCLRELREHYGTVGGTALAAAAVVLMCAAPARLAASLAVVLREARRERGRLRRGLAGLPVEPESGAVVVAGERPAAYCLPDRGGLIVLTSGAVSMLDREQLRAVVAHERAHLRGHHHRLAAVAEAAGRGFGRLPLFARLPERIGHLVELAADDAAARAVGSRVLAKSLLEVAAAQAPGGALAASGGDTVARIERLLRRPAAPGPAGIGTILGGNLAALAVPLLIVAAPVVTAVGVACCRI